MNTFRVHLVVSVLLFAGVAFGQRLAVLGSRHDLRVEGEGSHAACRFCHVRNDAGETSLANASDAAWIDQRSLTFNTAPESGAEQGKQLASSLCIGCHDGTVAPTVRAGPDRNDTHPLNVAANNATTDPSAQLPLLNGKIECATCHDPHRGRRNMIRPFTPKGAAAAKPLDDEVMICRACHR